VNEITAKFEMLDVSDIQEIKLRRKVEEDILKTLAYPAMTDRYEDIIEAFPETFEWAFKGSTEEQLSWDNLSEWLKAGSGVYWISGKAGSGKSTLMKHIFDDVRTRQFLKLWTTGNALNNQERHEIQFCLATFFFWNTGTSEQKSQSGLLRSLLYQALSSCPELIPVVFPEIWAKRYSDLIETLLPTALDWGLTLRRLTSAFRKLTQQTAVPLKLCFLVDGLDEFYGDHEELATLFKLATKSPIIKICLSSRPWVIFEGIYGSRPSMRLQDLTYYDIKHYVTSKFNNNPAFHRLQQRNPEAGVLLQSEVIEKAEGVFLWVQIVVKSLLLGIRQEDDIEMLRQRLIAMPPRVEDLYLHIISLIDPIYMTWASKTFQILRAARELCTDKSAGPIRRTRGGTQLNMLTFFFAITETFQFHINGFGETCLIEKDSSSTSGTLTQECLPVKCATIKTHLTARCAGLLEVPRFEQKGIDAPIQFFHQTAQDFIHKKDKWSQMVRYTQDTAFDPHRALLMASVLELAIRTADRSTKNEKVYSTVKTAIMYAYHLNLHQIPNPTETAVLDKLNQIMVFWSSRQNAQNSTNVHWSDHLIFDDLNFSAHTAFLRLTTLYGLANYVDEKLGKLDRKSAAKIASKLLYILLPDLPCESWRPDVRPPIERPEMISTLLHHGADPNFGRGLGSCQTTTWTNTLWHISNYASSSARCTPAFVHNMKLLLMAGADLYAKGGRGLREEDVESTVKNSIVSVARFRDEGLDLLDEIIRQKSLAATEAMDHGRDVRPRKKKRVEQEDLH
jgi:hypothetical protein